MNSLLIGGTGLVGSWVAKLYPEYFPTDNLVVYIRKQNLSLPKENPATSENVKYIEIDFENDKTWDNSSLPKIESLICTLGTTIKKAGSKDAFKKVDYEYPLNFAKWAKKLSFQRLSVVTAMGSNSDSSIFYNQVKGELEDVLATLAYPELNIFQPSLILGDRKEQRLGEELGKFASSLIPFSLLGLDKIKPIQAESIARAILFNLKSPKQLSMPCIQIFESDAIQKLATMD